MKKTITLSLIAIALALVSCHQPTKEEQQETEIRKAVTAYIKSISSYPDGIEITNVKVDTLISNHETAVFLSDLRWMGVMPDLLSVLDREVARDMAKADTMQALNDTTIADVFYCAASVLARHTDNYGKPVVDLYIVPIWDGKVGRVTPAELLDSEDEYMELHCPPEIRSVMKAGMLLSELIEYMY